MGESFHQHVNHLKLWGKRQINRFFCLTGKMHKRVVFDSFAGKQYSDNPRAVSEKMHELYPDYEIVWGILGADHYDRSLVPDYVKILDYRSKAYMKARSQAAAYVRNESMNADLCKKKGQFYIQTWHGDRGFKKILYDAWEGKKRPYKVMDSKLTDLFVLGSDYAAKRIRTAFRYEGDVLKEGCPRNDCLVAPEDEEKVRARIGIPEGKKILLYAPTLRVGQPVLQGTVDLKETLEHFQKRGGDWICLVRAHPKSLGISADADENVIDVSKYPDMSDLMMIADALITDYSSSAGDFILRKKAVILAQFDLEEYEKEDRKFHVSPAEAGFAIAGSQEDLNRLIDETGEDEWAARSEKIMEFYGTHESGRAAEEVCRRIDEHYRKVTGR